MNGMMTLISSLVAGSKIVLTSQIGEHAQQREHANDHHPCDSGSRVAMGPKQDPRDDRQLEQRDECDSEQRVVERCDHA